jgi:hypothetical protein
LLSLKTTEAICLLFGRVLHFVPGNPDKQGGEQRMDSRFGSDREEGILAVN